MLGNDTSGYIRPLESMVQGMGYDSVCRMPAFAPLYLLFYFLFGGTAVLSSLVFFQWFLSWISAILIFFVLLENAVPKRRSLFAASLYLAFPLAATYDHLILSDSLGNSLLICSLFFAWKAKKLNSNAVLFLASFFLIWSGFFRQIHFLFIPFLFWFVVPSWWTFSKPMIKKMISFVIPFFLLVGSWTAHNRIKYKQWIYTVAPYETCFGYLPKPLLELRKLMIALGGDIQPWVKGSAGEYFISKGDQMPLQANQFTTNMKEQEMAELKLQYQNFYYKNDSLAGEFVVNTSNKYLQEYIAEHPVQYYFTNRMHLLKQFMFPMHVDNLPGPPMHEMSLVQKGVKGIAWIGMWILNAWVFVSLFFIWKNARGWILVAVANAILVLVLACVFGWVELRYLLPVHSLSLLLFLLALGKYIF